VLEVLSTMGSIVAIILVTLGLADNIQTLQHPESKYYQMNDKSVNDMLLSAATRTVIVACV